MIESSAVYRRFAAVVALALGLVVALVGSASARATYDTETYLSKKGDWETACARVEGKNTTNAPPGNVKFRLKDRKTGESDSFKEKLVPKTGYSQVCTDLTDYLEDGHKYRLKATYTGHEGNKDTYEPSSDKRTFRYVE